MEKVSREYQKVIDYIYDQIDSGELTIGSKLPTERALAQNLTLSRNTTREALRTLENMGVIQSKQGSGNYLSDNMGQSISQMIRIMLLLKQTSKKDICEFRRIMEKTVCMTILTKDSINYLLKAKALLNEWPENDIQAESEIDHQFHFHLIMATQNSFWVTFMQALSGVYRQWITHALIKMNDINKNRLLQSHHHIVDALIEKNSQACLDAIDEHYDLIELLI